MKIIDNPCNTQQETNLYSTNEEDAMFGFPELALPVVRKESIPYSVLVPLAKELTSILEGNCTVEELEQYKTMLSNCSITKKK